MALQAACEQFITPEEIECDCSEVDADVLEEIIDQASDLIFILTGGVISGRCTIKVRPRSDGSCGSLFADHEIPLAGNNISIDQILINGDVLPEAAYVIADENYLVRIDGGSWPRGSNPYLPATDDNTFEVTYTHGIEAPALAREATAEIVCDMLRNPGQLTGRGNRLPPNARSTSIAGVSINLEAAAMEIRRRMPMLPNVLRLLTVYSPDGPAGPPFVYSPELTGGWTLHSVRWPSIDAAS